MRKVALGQRISSFAFVILRKWTMPPHLRWCLQPVLSSGTVFLRYVNVGISVLASSHADDGGLDILWIAILFFIPCIMAWPEGEEISRTPNRCGSRKNNVTFVRFEPQRKLIAQFVFVVNCDTSYTSSLHKMPIVSFNHLDI